MKTTDVKIKFKPSNGKDEEKSTTIRLPLFDDQGEQVAPEEWIVERAIFKAV